MPEESKQQRDIEEQQGEKTGRSLPEEGNPRQSVCGHPNASLGDRFCRDCGSDIPGPSRESVEEVVEGVLLRHGLLPVEGQEKPDPDAPLRQEYEQYEAAPRKWYQSPRYKDFAEFKSAPPEERKKELAKHGIKSAWVPKASPRIVLS